MTADLDAARREAEEALAFAGARCQIYTAPGCFGNLCGTCDGDYRWLRATLRSLLAMTAPAALRLPDGVREAAERADKAMRDVFGGIDQFGDYCGHPVMPGKLAYAVQTLLAALVAPAPEPEGEEKGVGK